MSVYQCAYVCASLSTVNLSDWADRVGVSKHTAYRWWRDGTLPVPAHRVGRLILVDSGTEGVGHARTVLYARVSSHDQRGDLDRQVSRLTEWATSSGLSLDEVVTEVGPGMDGRRRKLARILADPSAATIVVEHRDRLARFGVEHLEAALSAQGRRVAVVDPGEVRRPRARHDRATHLVLCPSVRSSWCSEPSGESASVCEKRRGADGTEAPSCEDHTVSRFKIPRGWCAKAYKFCLDDKERTKPERRLTSAPSGSPKSGDSGS